MIIDGHVHLFPPRVFEAIWRWFDTYAWNVKYRFKSEQVVSFLAEQGIDRMVALCYSHKPEMARALNRFVSELARAESRVIPLGTVFPGEPEAEAILDEAFGPLGLRGLKLHCHVQYFSPDDPKADLIYRRAAQAGVPIVMHSGNAPCTEGYPINPKLICSLARTRRVLERHPTLKLVVPHFGGDEVDEHFALLGEFEHLYLDTTMGVGGVYAPPPDPALLTKHADRILYGTDFPNIPCDWDTELKWLRANLSREVLDKILGGNAARLFD